MTRATEELERALRTTFDVEAKDLLRQVERALHGLAGGEPAERVERGLDMLRGLHTLKGAAAAVGEQEVKQAAHTLEDLVRGGVEGTLPLEGQGLEAIFAGLERLYEALGPAPMEPPRPVASASGPGVRRRDARAARRTCGSPRRGWMGCTRCWGSWCCAGCSRTSWRSGWWRRGSGWARRWTGGASWERGWSR